MLDFSLEVEKDLMLKAPRPQDAEMVFKIIDRQRKYLGQWLSWVSRQFSVEDTRHFIGQSLKFNQGGQQLVCFIWFQGNIVGSLSLVRIVKAHKKAEIGYWIDQNWQGLGIVSKCCRRMIAYSFEELSLNKLVIKVSSENEASKAVAKRLGFTLEGILREDVWMNNKWQNKEIYGLLKKD